MHNLHSGEKKLLTVARYRTRTNRPSCDKTPFLVIAHGRIVPIPLYLVLGICNRIIFEALPKLFGEDKVRATLARVRTVHRPGFGGLADVHQLNGPELQRWVKKNTTQELITAQRDNPEAEAESKLLSQTTAPVLNAWMQKLPRLLLNKKPITTESVNELSDVVDHILTWWTTVTSLPPFPKLHMLRHTWEFAKRWKILGRASESQMESAHAQVAMLYNNRHHNKTRDEPERMRRTLADAVLKAAVPLSQP